MDHLDNCSRSVWRQGRSAPVDHTIARSRTKKDAERSGKHNRHPRMSVIYFLHWHKKSPAGEFLLSQCPESNRRPTPYHGVALPAELHWQMRSKARSALGFGTNCFFELAQGKVICDKTKCDGPHFVRMKTMYDFHTLATTQEFPPPCVHILTEFHHKNKTCF